MPRPENIVKCRYQCLTELKINYINLMKKMCKTILYIYFF